jgi:uncharacterized protein with PIN domain
MPARFVTDSSLESLARRLRVLGYDVCVLRGARLEQVFAAAIDDDAIVLTLSARVPPGRLGVPRVRVPRETPEMALREIVGRYAPAGAPFSRCTVCNTPVERVEASEHAERPRGDAPPRFAPADPGTLRHCPECGHWYWYGSHVDRLRESLAAAIGRSVNGPG